MAYKYIMYRNKRYLTSRSKAFSYGILDVSTDATGSTINGLPNITEFAIPDGVTVISAHAFQNCTALTDIKIPEIGRAHV